MNCSVRQSNLRLAFILKILSVALQAAVGIITPFILIQSGGTNLYNSYAIIITLSSFYGLIEGTILWDVFNKLRDSAQNQNWPSYNAILSRSLIIVSLLLLFVFAIEFMLINFNSQLIYSDFSNSAITPLSFLLFSYATTSIFSIFNQALIANDKTQISDLVGLIKFPVIGLFMYVAYYLSNFNYILIGISASNIIALIMIANLHARKVENFKFELAIFDNMNVFEKSLSWSSLTIFSQIAQNAATTYIAGRYLGSNEFTAFNLIFKITDVLLQFNRKLIEAGQYTIKFIADKSHEEANHVKLTFLNNSDQFGILIYTSLICMVIVVLLYYPAGQSTIDLILLLHFFALGLIWNPLAHLSHFIGMTRLEYYRLGVFYILSSIIIVFVDFITAKYFGFKCFIYGKFAIYLILLTPVQCFLFKLGGVHLNQVLFYYVGRFSKLTAILIANFTIFEYFNHKLIALPSIIAFYIMLQVSVFRCNNFFVWLLRRG